MSAPKPRFNRYTLCAFALLLLGSWLTYEPLIRDKDAIVALTHDTEELSATQIIHKVQEKSSKPTLVYFYASWCDTCRITTPTLANYIRNRRLDDYRLIFIGLEHDGYALASYMLKRGYAGLWKPYFTTGLSSDLAKLSPAVVKGIPVVLAYDKSGKLRTTKQGVLRSEDLDAIIKSTARRAP